MRYRIAAIWLLCTAMQPLFAEDTLRLAETNLTDDIGRHWQQFKDQHLQSVTRWSDELESASRDAMQALEKAQHGSDIIVNILKNSKAFPPGLDNPKQTINDANVYVVIKQSYLQQLIKDFMSEPIPLDADVTNSYFQLRDVKIAFNEKRNVVMGFFRGGYAGFHELIKAGIKVNSATMQFAPSVEAKGNKLMLRLKARMTYIDIAGQAPVVDKLFASIAEELVLGKGFLLEQDLTPMLAVNQEISLFGQARKVAITPQEIAVNVNKDHMFIAAKL